jgi:hypothetical protein
MSFIDAVVDTVTDAASSFAQDLGWTTVDAVSDDTLEAAYQAVVNNNPDASLWNIAGKDWHKVFAYQFTISKGSDDVNEANNTKFYYTLPIPPQSMIVKPIIAAKATPTVGGVVEEASQTTFWLISMTGTTGTGVSRADGDELTRAKVAKEFRDRVTTTGLLAGVAAGANAVISQVGGVADQIAAGATAVANAENTMQGAAAIAGGLVGAANTAILPPLPYSGSAVEATTNGYTEIQHLQRFFYMYQRLKGTHPNLWSLHFTDFKADQTWRIILKDFSVQRNAQNPFLYRYQIVLQGWNVRGSVANRDQAEYDRFAEGGDLEPVNTVSIDALADGLSTVSDQLNLPF